MPSWPAEKIWISIAPAAVSEAGCPALIDAGVIVAAGRAKVVSAHPRQTLYVIA